MKKCYVCDREFVEKVKNAIRECLCHKWLIGEKDTIDDSEFIQFMCKDCYNEERRSKRIRDRAERELTPEHKKSKGKEKR